ncbi:MAG: nucleotidyltransferase domain-containing protein [Syntrophomonas sp.]
MKSTEELISTIRRILLTGLEPYTVIILGSAAADCLRYDSDIDIAFLNDKNLDSYDIKMVAEELAARLGRDVDLIDLKQVSPVMQVQVLTKGKLIHDNDPEKRQVFTILALKKYARLNEEREPVLKAIRQRGQVYA